MKKLISFSLCCNISSLFRYKIITECELDCDKFYCYSLAL
jgi:hypothetical protein